MNLVPELALVVYGDSNTREHLLSLHHIRNDAKGQPTLDAGRLLGATDAHDLAALLTGKEDTRTRPDFFPEYLLHADAESMTWYRPASASTQFWRTTTGRTTLNVVLPGLIFHARERALFVAAYADAGRPTMATPLFHAPLGNVYANTGVCLGNVRVPDAPTPARIDEWDRALLGSNYTHLNHHDVLRNGASTESLLAFWKRRQRTKTPPPERFLAPLGKPVRAWLGELHEAAHEDDGARW